MSEEQYQKQR